MEYDAKELVCHPRFQPIGEAAFMVSFGDAIHPEILRCASALVEALKDHPFPGLREVEASYTGVTVFYDPLILSRKVILPKTAAFPRVTAKPRLVWRRF